MWMEMEVEVVLLIVQLLKPQMSQVNLKCFAINLGRQRRGDVRM